MLPIPVNTMLRAVAYSTLSPLSLPAYHSKISDHQHKSLEVEHFENNTSRQMQTQNPNNHCPFPLFQSLDLERMLPPKTQGRIVSSIINESNDVSRRITAAGSNKYFHYAALYSEG